MKLRRQKLSITLVEAVVVIAIFAVIAATTGTILFTTTRSGRHLTAKATSFGDVSWALDYMVNEARWGRNFIIDPPEFPDQDVISFDSDTDHDSTIDDCVWYWRGFSETSPAAFNYGDNSTLYRGIDEGCGLDNRTSLQNATANAQELTRFLVDNPEDPDNSPNPLAIFDYLGMERRFSAILTTQSPSAERGQTMRAGVTALNADIVFDFSLNLVAHWSFDDGTADDVASGINGTFQRGATTVSEGKVQALRLERADSEYVDIPHSDSLMIESGITIAAWVKYTGVYSGVWGNRFIYKYGWDTGHTGPHLMVPAGGGLLEFSFNTGNLLNPYVVTSTQNYNDDQWHLVVATYDGSFSSLYVDGELEDQIPASGNINYLHPFQILLPSIYNPPHLGNSIGRNGDEDNRWFDGLIDEVRVWSRAYPIEDVESLYLSEVRYF